MSLDSKNGLGLLAKIPFGLEFLPLEDGLGGGPERVVARQFVADRAEALHDELSVLAGPSLEVGLQVGIGLRHLALALLVSAFCSHLELVGVGPREALEEATKVALELGSVLVDLRPRDVREAGVLQEGPMELGWLDSPNIGGL